MSTLGARPPRVVIDGRMVGDVPHGFARYVSMIAEGLRRVREERGLPYEPVFLVGRGQAPAPFSGFGTAQAGASFLSPLELLELPRLLKRLGADLYHSPTFSSLRGAPCPWIVTVHDLNHLKFGGWKERLYYERLLKPFMKGASAVATVSEFSRQEIASWSGLGREGIEVVPNAIDPRLLERVDPARVGEALGQHGLASKRYFFCLSNPKPHKNLLTLAEGYARYRALEPGRGPRWDLVLNLRPGELALPEAPGLRLVGRPSDEEARALVAGAGAVVFPSEYEGFGLPPVEAACQGAPLVVSRIPAHREALAGLFQGEALWVEPKDVDAWARALDRAARGQVLPASIESRSHLMKQFGVPRIGVNMDRLYRRVLKIDP